MIQVLACSAVALFLPLILLTGVASASGWSDNPTIPGNGTPQRSQGSGTR